MKPPHDSRIRSWRPAETSRLGLREGPREPSCSSGCPTPSARRRNGSAEVSTSSKARSYWGRHVPPSSQVTTRWRWTWLIKHSSCAVPTLDRQVPRAEIESLYCLAAILAPGRTLGASPEPGYHGETHEEGTPWTEDHLDPTRTEVEGRDGAKGEVHHERRQGRPPHRRDGRGRSARPGCRRERVHRPGGWYRSPDCGPSSAFRDPGGER